MPRDYGDEFTSIEYGKLGEPPAMADLEPMSKEEVDLVFDGAGTRLFNYCRTRIGTENLRFGIDSFDTLWAGDEVLPDQTAYYVLKNGKWYDYSPF